MDRQVAASMTANSALPITVVCTPGLEFVTRQELTSLNLPGVVLSNENEEAGVVSVSGDLLTLYAMNLHLRSASRLLIPLGDFNAAAFSELRKKASRLPWSPYVNPGRPVNIRVTTHASQLYHKKGIAERIAGAIQDSLGKPSALVTGDDESGAEAQIIVVRLVRNHCFVSIDSSGEHLHRRGYRLQSAKAPLRENLAASVLLASGWPGDVPLVDPFCGSGTIPIEAALIAAGIPPGLNRRFAFESWPSFQPLEWAQVKKTAIGKQRSVAVEIMGSDRDAGAINASRANAERAGVSGQITWTCRSISDLQLPGPPGWIVTNPPYGERVKGGPDLRNLYARMGSVWRQQAGLWHSYLVTSSPKWSGQLGMPCAVVARFNNGGLPVQFLKVNQHDHNVDEGGDVRRE